MTKKISKEFKKSLDESHISAEEFDREYGEDGKVTEKPTPPAGRIMKEGENPKRFYEQADQTVKQPAANSLRKQRIRKLYRMFCEYLIVATPDMIHDCSGCLLREIPWDDSKGQRSDLCHAIWQEGILNV